VDGRLVLSKIGPVKIRLHRPCVGQVKTCTIRRIGRKWFACFACEAPPEPLPDAGNEVGIRPLA
jgi:putative transposase